MRPRACFTTYNSFFPILLKEKKDYGRMDQRTDGRIDIPSYREARTHKEYMTLRISIEHLLCHLILELLPHPKLPYFTIVTCALAPGVAYIHSSLLASDTSRCTLGKTREYGN